MIESVIRGGQLRGKKTYITAITGIVSAVGLYLSGELDIFMTMQAVFPMLGILFLRKSISETIKEEPDDRKPEHS
ncbi:MAG: hypothetical protein LBH81_00070 [Rickettsiales bacterium]|jgi:hypothetical protein|nr:hypothetical protein [Rickettsiales bacterium]